MKSIGEKVNKDSLGSLGSEDICEILEKYESQPRIEKIGGITDRIRDISSSFQRPRPNRQNYIQYVCPNCNGKFSKFHKKTSNIGSPKCCPFCGLERFSYNPEKKGGSE